VTGPPLTPELLLRGYRAGIFPMSESQDDADVFWVDPHVRGILPLDGFRISRSLRRTMRSGRFSVTYDTDIAGVLDGCAARPETWINATIREMVLALAARGEARSIEVREGDVLVGGVYGIVIGAAFFGESMFSRRTDASKLALAYLIDRLRAGGFTLFDTQFPTPHLASLGGQQITRVAYRKLLAEAVSRQAEFDRQGAVPSPQEVMHRNGQTS